MQSSLIRAIGGFSLLLLLSACGGGTSGSDGGGGEIGGIDSTAPYVIATTPVHNSSAVETNRAITATFSEAIDPATMTNNSFLLETITGTIVTGTVSYDANSPIATLRHGGLTPETTYVATITSDIEDLEGNAAGKDYTWQFTTGSTLAPGTEDTTSPVVLTHFPASNATNVAPNTLISVTFNEPIDASTINTQTLSLNGTGPVSGNVSYVGTSALFEPTTPLAENTVYTVSLAGSVQDLAGNSLGASVIWNFTTAGQADIESPRVTTVSPNDGAINVPIDTSFEVTFSEPIKPFQFGIIDGRPVIVTFNNTYTRVTLIPTTVLKPGQTYQANISVVDQAGIPMEKPFIWQFTTAR